MTNTRNKQKIRVDQLLIMRGLAPDLAKARALVMAGQVVADDKRIDKPGELLAPSVELRLKGTKAFVSRAGEKLARAVEDLGISRYFADRVVLDVGASTGGFTEVALQLGAHKVIACDVGQNQLAWELRIDSRVECIERTDIRDLEASQVGVVGVVVADVSFISLARLVPDLVRLGGLSACYVLLVKPQFELPRELIPVGGVVTDPGLREQAVEAVIVALKAAGLANTRQVDSRVPGRSGNVEVFVLATADPL